MATFSSSSMFGIDMLDVSFRKLGSTFLNARRTEVSAEAISSYVDVWGDGDTGTSVDYGGSFTYTYGEDGAILGVEGRVTSYDFFDWYALSVSFESEWDGFEMSGFDVDLSVLETTPVAVLFADIFCGDDTIRGAAGYDDLYGFAGNDRIDGFARGDLLDGGTGADTMDGGAGDDTFIVDDVGDVVIEGDKTRGGIDTVRSSVGYQLTDSVENLVLLEGARFGYGNQLANRLTGSEVGDLLKGGLGVDSIDGGNGSDRIHGERGADVLTGGGGVDIFFYQTVLDSTATAADRISDFSGGVDIINLAGVDANVRRDGNQKFKFIGTADFSSVNASAQVRFDYDEASDTGTLYASIDADTDAEIVVELSGVSTLSAGDLVL